MVGITTEICNEECRYGNEKTLNKKVSFQMHENTIFDKIIPWSGVHLTPLQIAHAYMNATPQ